jgi:hypothetical protein
MKASHDDQQDNESKFNFLLRTTIMFMIIFIYLHALHFVINVMFLWIYMFCT